MNVLVILATISIIGGCLANFDNMPEKTYQTISTPSGNIIIIVDKTK